MSKKIKTPSVIVVDESAHLDNAQTKETSNNNIFQTLYLTLGNYFYENKQTQSLIRASLIRRYLERLCIFIADCQPDASCALSMLTHLKFQSPWLCACIAG